MRSEDPYTPCIPGMEPVEVPTTPDCRVAPCVTVRDVTHYHRCSAATVYRWIVQGRIPQPQYATGRATWHPDLLPLIELGPQAQGTYPRLTRSPAADRAAERHHRARLRAAVHVSAGGGSRTRKKTRVTKPKKRAQKPTLPGHESRPPAPKKGGKR